mmetsp:Transcript_1946/g.3340  ORF Transcript_1946/g.3340 Transcript_1946/m.3340 type:complete len:297 (+) Transcript_1946:388-1278(+)
MPQLGHDVKPAIRASFLLVEPAAQLQELLEGGGELAEVQLLVRRVRLHRPPELWVPHKGHVRGKHHQLAAGVLVLGGARPLLPLVRLLQRPLLLQQQAEVLVAEGGLRARPGPPVARAVLVAAAQRVRPDQAHRLPVGEAHPTEDVADVLDGRRLGAHVRVGQTALGGAGGALGGVRAARAEGHAGPAHSLHRRAPRQHPQVRMRELGVAALQGREEVARDGQAGVGPVARLGREPHGGACAPARAVCLGVCPCSMPCETDKGWTNGGSITPLFSILLDQSHNFLFDLTDIRFFGS